MRKLYHLMLALSSWCEDIQNKRRNLDQTWNRQSRQTGGIIHNGPPVSTGQINVYPTGACPRVSGYGTYGNSESIFVVPGLKSEIFN